MTHLNLMMHKKINKNQAKKVRPDTKPNKTKA